MNHRTHVAVAAAVVVAALALTPRSIVGQDQEDGGGGAGRGPRPPAGPPPSTTPQFTPDGQPDIQGYYAPQAPNATHSLEEGEEPDNVVGRTSKTLAQIEEERKNRKVVIVDPEPGPMIPYQAWARAWRRDELVRIYSPTEILDVEPEDRCALQGVPRINYREDFEIQQSPGLVTILYEWNHDYRTIPLDGRPHLDKNVKLANGDSRGHWEGNTLVVDVTNFNEETWFDAHASFHSDALHVVERFTFVNSNTVNYQATMTDPKVFTRPWTMAFALNRVRDPKFEIYEEACVEGNDLTLEGTIASGKALKAKGVTKRHEHTPGFYDEK